MCRCLVSIFFDTWTNLYTAWHICIYMKKMCVSRYSGICTYIYIYIYTDTCFCLPSQRFCTKVPASPHFWGDQRGPEEGHRFCGDPGGGASPHQRKHGIGEIIHMEYSFFINFYIHHNIHCKYIQFLFGSPEMLLFIDFPATCDHRLLIKTSWRLAGPFLEISKTSKPRRPGFALGKRIYKLYIYIYICNHYIIYETHWKSAKWISCTYVLAVLEGWAWSPAHSYTSPCAGWVWQSTCVDPKKMIEYDLTNTFHP